MLRPPTKRVCLVVVLICCVANLVFAQAARKTADQWLRGWDANKDGFLQKSEIPNGARSKVEQMAKGRGLDVRKPLRIDTLAGESVGKKSYVSASDKKSAKSSAVRDARAKKKLASLKNESKAESAETAKPKTRSRSGFRKLDDRKQVKGFGKSDGKTANEDQPAESPDDSAPKDSSNNGASKKESAAKKQLKVFARSMMFQHDKNKNGRLEKTEWSRLKGNPRASDRDGDGALSMSELTEHLGSYGKREQKTRSYSNRTRSKLRSGTAKKSYRFLPPHERLPDGLPPWFTENDSNGDGQLSLREYASSFSMAKLKKFKGLDLNNDGLIVGKEYLRATEVK